MSNFTKMKLCHNIGISQSAHLWMTGIFTLLLLFLTGSKAKAQSDLTFNEGIRYSQWVIDSRMNNFYANTTECGFAVYDQTGKQTAGRKDGKTSLDYVVGLVAKSIIEASQYYSQFQWAQSFAKPWFLSIQNYGDNFYTKFKTEGGSLDDLNAVKLFIPLREMTATGRVFANNGTYTNTTTALNNAIKGLKAHNTDYVIKDENILAKTAGYNVLGGWWHKKAYENQMWLDGAYMGPALFAQLVNYSGKTTNIDSSNDWDLIVKQFEILRSLCWNPKDELPYHAFAADGGANSTSHSDTWAGLKSTSPYCFHSASYWGRAAGWYFLALVDILEEMDKANISASDQKYTKLKGYLTEISQGLAKRQDQAKGGWYQILDETDTYSASEYNNGKSHTVTKNYIESSATALFTAAYLKAIRRGYISETGKVTVNGTAKTYKDIAVDGYKCLVNNFFSLSSDGKVNIFGSCRSAGLGGSGNDYKSGAERFRDGSKAYYLLGYDVAKVAKSENVTEGKVLGAFILAATEYERLYQNTTLLAKDLNPSYTIKSGKAISVEVLGDGTAKYQWYNASTDQAVSGATSASFAPTKSGKYKCIITVTPATSAKTRAASTGTYEITTSATDVTVEESSTGGETSTGTVVYFTGNEKTTSNEDVLTVVSGDMKSKASTITYKGSDYSNALKIGSSTKLTLKLTTESDVTLVFDTHTSGNYTIKVGDTKYPIDTDGLVKIQKLAAGEYTITKGDSNPNLYAVDIQPAGPSMSVSTQPKSADYVTGGKAADLSVGVTFSNATESDYTLSYQWYSNTEYSTTGGTAVGTNANTYTPVITSAGTTYYYCVVTATKKEGAGTLTATSAVATITVSEPYVEFTTQPTGGQYTKDAEAAALTVGATTNVSNVTISYQWYQNTTGSIPEDKTLEKITDATSSTYTPSTTTTGTTYYYCVASVKNGSETISATSDIVSVEVVGELYSVKVDADSSTPKCNESWYIKGKSGENLVKMTFGGWKWGTNDEKNNHTYLRPNKTDNPDNYITDAWKAPVKQDKVNPLDGYEYAISGTYDAVHEDKTATTYMYGATRYGWFVSPTRENGITTASYPFTLPVRGAYMTFEPTQNGTLTIYLLQNGAWNSDTENNIDIIPGEFRMHAFQITNQRGLVLEEFAPQYKITVNQKVMDGYTCSAYELKDKPATTYEHETEEVKNYKDIIYWKEFWDLSDAERKAVHDNWKNGTNGSQTIIKLENGSFLAIQKAIVKYQFHVTGNETYYMFSNFSKLGFSGATFQPDDAQPTDVTTFSGVNSLSDDKAYTKINATKLGTTIEGSNLYDYKYTIGEGESAQEVGKVDGVFIPQFKEITLKRTFKANQWTTLTLPFNLTETEVQNIFGEGTRLIMLKEGTIKNEGARLTFIYHEIQNVLPGYPYLIKPKQNVTTFTAYNKCINPHIDQLNVDCGDYWHKGTPGYCTANVTMDGTSDSDYSICYPENHIFVSEGNGNLYVSEGGSYGKGYRSWIAKKTVAEGGTSQTAKSISVVIGSFSDDDNTTTEIDVAEMAPDLLEALGIQTGVYNLNGQRVANDTRNLKAGIYIVNGKKTVVR